MSLKQRVVGIINRKEINAEILIFLELNKFLDFPGGLAVKYLPAMHEMLETQVWSLGWEDPLEQEMATHSSIGAWRIPWTEEPSRLRSMGSQRAGHDWATKQH